MALLWEVWKERNMRTFESKESSVGEMNDRIHVVLWLLDKKILKDLKGELYQGRWCNITVMDDMG
ncbi:hypothetical protein Scep_012847 [Stephania cephalantha]|uniref:Uncharacterized protein n=1 Tax=Stephania cephalantha TaxID=152367 RepID=A0AAP0JFV2_9MAGN